MSNNNKRIITFSAKEVKLITDESSGFAVASISRNPNITWIKFILLDDQPNANKHRVPKEEFDNVVKTGIFMPLKMASAEENKEHDNSEPLGVITHLVINENLIEAIAALWKTERTEDVHSIVSSYKEGKDINISWELNYTDEEQEDDGITSLRNISMNAATIVDIPAYGGRTPVVALAGLDTEGETMETIEKAKHDEIVNGLNEKIGTLEATVEENNSSLQKQLQELEELREYKNSAEAEKQKAEKLVSIKERFSEAGLEVDEAFFADRQEFLLNLDTDALDFYVQDMVAFATKEKDDDNDDNKDEKASKKFGSKLPNLEKKTSEENDFKSVADYLKSRD